MILQSVKETLCKLFTSNLNCFSNNVLLFTHL